MRCVFKAIITAYLYFEADCWHRHPKRQLLGSTFCGAVSGFVRRQNNKSWRWQTKWIIAGVKHTQSFFPTFSHLHTVVADDLM